MSKHVAVAIVHTRLFPFDLLFGEAATFLTKLLPQVLQNLASSISTIKLKPESFVIGPLQR